MEDEFENPMRPRNPVAKRLAFAALGLFGGLAIMIVLGAALIALGLGGLGEAVMKACGAAGIGGAVVGWKTPKASAK